MYTEKLEFYPKHPSDEKTHIIETTAMPILEQRDPFSAKSLYDEFITDSEEFFAKYVDKRFEITGIAKKVGPDIHNKPSIEISDSINGQTYGLVIFPTDDHYSKVKVGDKVVVRANYLVMSNHFGTVMKYSELVSVEKENQEKTVLNYPFFDGRQVIENSSVVIKDGKIEEIVKCDEIDNKYFLMPGLIDAHTHMGTQEQIKKMLKMGVTCTCDVAASPWLVENSKAFIIVSSAGMTMGTLNGKAYVKNAISSGAKYIKVLLMEPILMMKSVLKDICSEAHLNGLKVAVHAVSLKAVKLAVECGIDILIHIPMKEKFPKELAETIAEKGIVVAPTLVMMEAFSKSGRNGYKLEHFQNAKEALRLLHQSGVKIIAATDANDGSFAPAVDYGISMHRELELLVQSGMTPTEALTSATSAVAEVFDLENLGTIEAGKEATLLVIEGRPVKNIIDTRKIKQIWINGKRII